MVSDRLRVTNQFTEAVAAFKKVRENPNGTNGNTSGRQLLDAFRAVKAYSESHGGKSGVLSFPDTPDGRKARQDYEDWLANQ